MHRLYVFAVLLLTLVGCGQTVIPISPTPLQATAVQFADLPTITNALVFDSVTTLPSNTVATANPPTAPANLLIGFSADDIAYLSGVKDSIDYISQQIDLLDVLLPSDNESAYTKSINITNDLKEHIKKRLETSAPSTYQPFHQEYIERLTRLDDALTPLTDIYSYETAEMIAPINMTIDAIRDSLKQQFADLNLPADLFAADATPTIESSSHNELKVQAQYLFVDDEGHSKDIFSPSERVIILYQVLNPAETKPVYGSKVGLTIYRSYFDGGGLAHHATLELDDDNMVRFVVENLPVGVYNVGMSYGYQSTIDDIEIR